MRRTPKYARKRHRRKTDKLAVVLCSVAGFLLVVVVLMLLFLPKAAPSQPGVNQPTATHTTGKDGTAATVPGETVLNQASGTPVQAETQPQILPYFVDMAAKNPDMVGWIKIEGTKLDYPLMYTPEDPERYLHRNFDGIFSVGGLPFVDENCKLDPVSDNLLIYGHNMENGTMFRTLMSYDQKTFWEKHPFIHMSTLYEEKTYEIIAAVYDRVYLKAENCFKFYQFIDAASEEEFNEAIAYFKSHALYDTGVTAEYGDKLITLVTCSYHVDNGRFIVVAKEVQDK